MWSLSRPILALIVLNEAWFAQIKEDLVRGQPEDRQKHAVQCLAKLMDNVERNLEPKNRDTFTHVRSCLCVELLRVFIQNLSTLKHDFKGKK